MPKLIIFGDTRRHSKSLVTQAILARAKQQGFEVALAPTKPDQIFINELQQELFESLYSETAPIPHRPRGYDHSKFSKQRKCK